MSFGPTNSENWLRASPPTAAPTCGSSVPFGTIADRVADRLNANGAIVLGQKHRREVRILDARKRECSGIRHRTFLCGACVVLDQLVLGRIEVAASSVTPLLR